MRTGTEADESAPHRPQSEPRVEHEIPAPGELVASKYRVVRVLGEGGMGIVVEATHVQLGHRVAIKFVRKEAARSADRFWREARASVALTSEHATRVLDVGSLETGAPYIVMEYLDGVDLEAVLGNTGPLGVPDAVWAILQVSEPIAEAHALGIVHRDLKPSNLFLTKRRDGTPLVKLLDFGVSKMTDVHSTPDPGLTGAGTLLGSPSYMSPEQARDAAGVDSRSDIWAIGACLYKLLSGVDAFDGRTPTEVLAKIVSENPRPIRQHRPEVPEGLAEVIGGCLERMPERRIQSVGELAARLLPFGPPEAALLVQRIVRVSEQHGARRGREFGAAGARRTARMSLLGASLAIVAGAPLLILYITDRRSVESRAAAAPLHAETVPAPSPPSALPTLTASATLEPFPDNSASTQSAIRPAPGGLARRASSPHAALARPSATVAESSDAAPASSPDPFSALEYK
ncbi:MAG TPA: serine/threonine-protein kinase [Polyangiaceae bacterium]|nr:serine/threonine-protein kinase [Polyangiaceae bacterium]